MARRGWKGTGAARQEASLAQRARVNHAQAKAAQALKNFAPGRAEKIRQITERKNMYPDQSEIDQTVQYGALRVDIYRGNRSVPLICVTETEPEEWPLQVVDYRLTPQKALRRSEVRPQHRLQWWGPIEPRRWMVPIAHWHGSPIKLALQAIEHAQPGEVEQTSRQKTMHIYPGRPKRK